ncbi:hypothetical protein FB451DRAFT_1387463 [Mycena latifolia]|nr:hypothetical protein FB451DRAFT_1387463 [Mycena latifolia]
MSPTPWATKPQMDWLQSWMKDYITRQAEGKLHLFWPNMLEAWFRKFPEYTNLGLPTPNDPNGRALTDEEMAALGLAIQARRKKLENWFRNHRAKASNRSASAPGASAATRKLFQVNIQKRHRAHQPIEVFQKRNKALIDEKLDAEGYNALNEEKMAEELDDWANEAEDTTAGRLKRAKSDRMRMRTRVVSALFAEASKEELDEIEKEIAREKEAQRSEEEAMEKLDASVPRSRTPWELQDAIDQLDRVYKETHHATYDAAGWVGMTILGGPNPRLDGELSIKIICFGETPAGNDFEDVCIDFDKNVIEPFEAFMRAAYTAEQCKATAMPARSEPPAPEGRAARDEAPVSAPKEPNDPKTIPVSDTTPIAPDSSLADELDALLSDTDSPLGDLDASVFLDTIPPADSTSFDIPMDHDDDDDLFGSPAAEGFNPWPPGMPPPSSPATAAAAAMRERGGIAGGAMMLIDPQLLPPGTPTPRPTTPTPRPVPRAAYKGTAAYAESRDAAAIATTNVGGFNFPLAETQPVASPVQAQGDYRPSELFEAFRSATKPAPVKTSVPQRKTSGPTHSASFTTPGFASMTARAMAGLVATDKTLAPKTTLATSRPSAEAPVVPKPAAIAPQPTASAPLPLKSASTPIPVHASASNGEVVAGAPVFPQSRPPAKAPRVKAPKKTVKPAVPPIPAPASIGDDDGGDAASEVPVLPQSRPPAKAPGAPRKKGTANQAAKEAAAKEAKKVEAVKAVAKRGRPKKVVVDEGETPLANATNGGKRGPRAVRFSAAAEIQRFEELNKAANDAEAAAALKAAGGIIRLPNPDGPSDTIVLTRTRKPTKLADGSKVQLPVKGKRTPVNPHAASEAAMLARSAGTSAATKKRKAPGTENVTVAPRTKK